MICYIKKAWKSAQYTLWQIFKSSTYYRKTYYTQFISHSNKNDDFFFNRVSGVLIWYSYSLYFFIFLLSLSFPFLSLCLSFFSLLVCLFVLRMTRRVHYLLYVTAMIIELFFYLGFLLRTFMIHRTSGEGKDYFLNSSLPIPPTSQTITH